jgi:uncharacterized protein (TIGR02679 family)
MADDRAPLDPRAALERRELAPLWDELARRWSDGPEPVAVTVRGLSLPERQALADLLGADRLPGESMRLTVARLAVVLGVDGPAGVRSLTERLRGPLPDRAALRRAHQASRAALWDWFERSAAAVPLLAGHPGGAARWVATVRAAGPPGGDVDAGRHRLQSVLAAVAALPADGTPLAAFASDTIGSPHALDRGRWAAAAVLGAVAAVTDSEPPTDAESARELWERVGVAPDPLSSTVLIFGLRPAGPDPVAAYLLDMAEAGEAAVLTLAQLRRWPLAPLASTEVVYVVENPSLVADAAGRHRAGPPLVCSSGRPTVAAVTSLRQLGAGGAALRQHADFDPAGLGITAWLAARAGTVPWRMSADDYRAAARPDGTPLVGRIPPTPWDPTLAGTMSEVGVIAYEEDVRGGLLDAMGY